MERVTADDLRLAAEWCDSYESDDEDQERVHRVAKWLREWADSKEFSALVRKIQRETGCFRQRAIAEAKKLMENR